MDGRSILLSLIPVGLTLINYAIIRDLLWGILLGSKSQKSAETIRKEAEGWPKFSQRYIEPHLTKFQKDYKNWMTLKLITALAAILQIAAFILLIFVFNKLFRVRASGHACGVSGPVGVPHAVAAEGVEDRRPLHPRAGEEILMF